MIAEKLSLEDVSDFELSTAYDAWFLSKNGVLGYRIKDERWFVVQDNAGNASVGNNLTIGGKLEVGGDLVFDKNLSVEGETWLRGKVRIEEDTTLDGDVYIHSNLYVSKNFQLGQDGSISGDLSVNDLLTVNDLIVTGNASINSLLNVDNDQVVTGNLDVGGNITDGSGDVRNDINDSFLNAYSTYYSEFTYDVSGNLTNVDVWETSGKLLKLFSKVLTYTTGSLTGVSLTDEVNTKTLTKVFSYDVSGNLSILTRAYT